MAYNLYIWFQDWIDEKENRSMSNKYVWNKEQFEAINSQQTDYVLGERCFLLYYLFFQV